MPQHRHHSAWILNSCMLLACSEAFKASTPSCLIHCPRNRRGVQKPSSQCTVTPSTQHHKSQDPQKYTSHTLLSPFKAGPKRVTFYRGPLIPIRIPVGSGLSPGVCASLTKLGFDNTNPALFGCSWVSLGGAKSGIWCQWVPLPSGHLVVPAPQRGLLGVIWHVSRYTQPAIPARAISRLVHAPAVTVATPQLLALCAQCKSVADILRYPNDTNAVVLSNTRD